MFQREGIQFIYILFYMASQNETSPQIFTVL